MDALVVHSLSKSEPEPRETLSRSFHVILPARTPPTRHRTHTSLAYSHSISSLQARATAMADDSGSGTESNGGGSFLTTGGSTLILAFLAIGLFVGGLLVMFSMRRYVMASRRRAAGMARAGERVWDWDELELESAPTPLMSVSVRRKKRDFGKVPELWDVCARRAQGDDWEEIQVCLQLPNCAAYV